MRRSEKSIRTVALSVSMTAILLLASLLAAVPAALADDIVPPASEVTPQQVRDSVVKGLAWLTGRQMADGSWEGSCGVTGLVLMCYEAAGFDYTNQTVQRGLTFLRPFYDPATGSFADSFLTYETAINLVAILGAGDPQDKDKIPVVTRRLLDIQYTAETVPDMNKSFFGGWPNYASISDASNSQFALLALMTAMLLDARVDVPDRTFINMTEYNSECQNWPATNSMSWAHDATLPSYGDGGFVYNTLRSRTALGEKKFESYGSITAAGLFNYLVCGHYFDNAETVAAQLWTNREFSTSKNPRMEGKGLFYYLWTLSRVLAMSPEDSIIDSAGKVHNWRSDIASAIIGKQRTDGGWDGNPATGWREEEPELASMYSVFTMAAAYLMVPNPKLELEVTGASSARFIGLDGVALKTDAAKGLTVTGTKLTCTDPETFRKVWVDISGTNGQTATVKATGTWGQDRKAETSVSVKIGSHGARVFSGTGGFAGPFGIFLMPVGDGPALKVTPGGTIELLRGRATVVTLTVQETTGVADATLVDVIASLPTGTIASVDKQQNNVTKGGKTVLTLDIFVPENAPKGDAGHILVTSITGPAIQVKVKYVDELGDGGKTVPTMVYWALILALFVIVAILIALPGMRKGKGAKARPERGAEGGPKEEPKP